MRACVFGASGGIGAAFVDLLAADDAVTHVYAGMRRSRPKGEPKIEPFSFTYDDEASIASAASRIEREGPLDLAIVATGILHRGTDVRPEKSFQQINRDAMSEVFAVNTVGPALIGKYFLPLMATEGRPVLAFLSARVGSIDDNRLGGWHSYRASKAALNALVRCFSIELKRRSRQSVVVALHPGTVDTNLSMPFQRNVPEGQLFEPTDSARKMLGVMGALDPEDTGGFFDWAGKPVPF